MQKSSEQFSSPEVLQVLIRSTRACGNVQQNVFIWMGAIISITGKVNASFWEIKIQLYKKMAGEQREKWQTL